MDRAKLIVVTGVAATGKTYGSVLTVDTTDFSKVELNAIIDRVQEFLSS